MSACFDHNHMTFEEFGVYSYIRAVSHQSHVFYSDGRGLAAAFAGEGKNPAYRVINSLVKKEWLVLTKEGGRSRFGTMAPNQYEAVDHEIWAAKHPGQCHQPLPKRGQVPKGNSTSPRTGNNLSQNREQPVPERGHRFIKKEEKRKEREKDLMTPVPESGQVATNQTHTLSPVPAGLKPSTEKTSVEDFVDYIIATAQKQNSAAAFSGGANKKLMDVLRKIGKLKYTEIDSVIRTTLAGCDDFMLRNFGSHLSAQLVGSVKALRSKQKEREEEQERKRPVADWREDLRDAMHDFSIDLDDWGKKNPPPHGSGLGLYQISEAIRLREHLLAERDRWFEQYEKHVREDEDFGWAWWESEYHKVDDRPAGVTAWDPRNSEDEVIAYVKKEQLERRAAEAATVPYDSQEQK